MNPAQQVGRHYYDAWTSGDRHTVSMLLAPTFRFAAGDLKIEQGRHAQQRHAFAAEQQQRQAGHHPGLRLSLR